MDEQHNGETDNSANPTDSNPDHNDKPRAPAGREMLIQLQQMIDTVSYQAAPFAREVAAKAAELAAVAAQKAGPLAYRAAGATEQFGQRVAARGKSVAADLRRPRGEEEPSADEAPAAQSDSGSSDSSSESGSESESGDSPPSL